MSRWSVAAAATVGERHIADGRPCEDAWTVRLHTFRGEPWMILAVSDGAGTAGRAQAGSACAVAAFADSVVRSLNFEAVMTREVITTTEETPLMNLIHVLQERHLIRLPVVKDQKLIGMVARRDIVFAYVKARANYWP